MEPIADLALPGLIHDLNNVFQTLMDAADSLAGDPRWEALSAALFRSIDRGRQITQSMQTIHQPSAPFETVLRNARMLVEDSTTLSEGPRLQFLEQVEPAIILRNAWAWERVLINLFCNAVQAMPQGGTIFVKAYRKQGHIQIVVADEGPGIAPELLPMIFDPHISTKVLGGLGLHIVQSIVTQQEGEVRASNRQGGGAEFTITLPAEPVLSRSASV
ncbi:MAG: sensor histidine kinase [Acidobacteriota bacterium]|nr:sensor histidine kinase [Acidobacteriota bacterium]